MRFLLSPALTPLTLLMEQCKSPGQVTKKQVVGKESLASNATRAQTLARSPDSKGLAK